MEVAMDDTVKSSGVGEGRERGQGRVQYVRKECLSHVWLFSALQPLDIRA